MLERRYIADVLQKIMTEFEQMPRDEDSIADYNCGYVNAILDIAFRFKMTFHRQEDGSNKIKDRHVR